MGDDCMLALTTIYLEYLGNILRLLLPEISQIRYSEKLSCYKHPEVLHKVK